MKEEKISDNDIVNIAQSMIGDKASSGLTGSKNIYELYLEGKLDNIPGVIPVGYLVHKASRTKIPVYEKIGWFEKLMWRLHNVRYEKFVKDERLEEYIRNAGI